MILTTLNGKKVNVNLDRMLYCAPIDSGDVPIIGQEKPPDVTKIVFDKDVAIKVRETPEEIHVNQL